MIAVSGVRVGDITERNSVYGVRGSASLVRLRLASANSAVVRDVSPAQAAVRATVQCRAARARTRSPQDEVTMRETRMETPIPYHKAGSSRKAADPSRTAKDPAAGAVA